MFNWLRRRFGGLCIDPEAWVNWNRQLLDDNHYLRLDVEALEDEVAQLKGEHLVPFPDPDQVASYKNFIKED